jgi:hypothetical protein
VRGSDALAELKGSGEYLETKSISGDGSVSMLAIASEPKPEREGLSGRTATGAPF